MQWLRAGSRVKRKFRLTRSIDFKRVRRSGRSYAHPLAVIIVSKGISEETRVGIICSKAIGSAVKRNRVKRQLREILTSCLADFQPSTDLLVIAREPAREASYQDLQSAILELLGRADLIVTNHNGTGRSTHSR